MIVTWQDAEQLAARWMATHGFPDAVVTSKGADGGIDVSATDAVAQVKFSATRTSRPQVQNLAGVANVTGRQALFFSLAGYSRSAVQWADDANVALFVYDHLEDVIPANSQAWQINDADNPATAGTSGGLNMHIANHLSRGRRRSWREEVAVLTPQLRGEPVRAVAFGTCRTLFGHRREVLLVLTPLRLLAVSRPERGRIRSWSVPRSEFEVVSLPSGAVRLRRFGEKVKLRLQPPNALHQPFIDELASSRR